MKITKFFDEIQNFKGFSHFFSKNPNFCMLIHFFHILTSITIWKMIGYISVFQLSKTYLVYKIESKFWVIKGFIAKNDLFFIKIGIWLLIVSLFTFIHNFRVNLLKMRLFLISKIYLYYKIGSNLNELWLVKFILFQYSH